MAKRTDSNIILLDNADAELNVVLIDVEKQILDGVLNYLDKFPVSGGKFDSSKKPFALIAQIKKELKRIIQKSDYESAINEYLLNFEGINDNIRAIQKNANGISVPKSLITPLQKALVEETQTQLLEFGVNARFADPIKKALFTQINLGGTLEDTRKIMRQIITPADSDGVLSKYAGQVARDAGQQYEGHVNQIIKTEFNLNALSYVGSIVKDSRAQCKRWVKMEIIKDSELKKEIEWAYKNGGGMIPGTTVENFLALRGGYNCRHSAYPTNA